MHAQTTSGPVSRNPAATAVVPVCNARYELENIDQWYRDRADCESGFDEITNQRGWGGYGTHDIELRVLSARAVALVCN